MKLSREKIQERRRAIKEFGNYMRACEEDIKRLDSVHQDGLKKYQDKIHDMEDLKEFARTTFEDPRSTQKRLDREIGIKNDRLKALEEELASVNTKFPAQVKEFEVIVNINHQDLFLTL